MTTETRAEFARRLGVHRSIITRAAQAGRLVLAEDGQRVEVEASLARWHGSHGGRSDVAARHAAHRGREVPQASGVAGVAPGVTEAQQDGAGDTDQSRTRYKAMVVQARNSAKKLRMAVSRRLRFSRESAEIEARGIGASVRGGVERMVDLLTPQIAVARDQVARMEIFEAGVAELRRSFRKEGVRAMRRIALNDAAKKTEAQE